MSLELISLKGSQKNKRPFPLLFVHGSFCSAIIWQQNFMPFFQQQGYDCYALSLRGHGQSDSPSPLHFQGLVDYVDDIATIISGFDTPPVLIGHSLGGFVVQKFLEKNPAKGAVLMNSLPPSGAMSSIQHMAFNHTELYWQLNTACVFGPQFMGFDALYRLLVSKGTPQKDLSDIQEHFQSESLRALFDATCFDLPRRPPLTKNLPVYVIGGNADVMIPTSALEETAAFYKAELTIQDKGPHGTMLDKNWQTSAEHIANWINKLP